MLVWTQKSLACLGSVPPPTRLSLPGAGWCPGWYMTLCQLAAACRPGQNLHLQLDTHAPLIIYTTLCLVHCMINQTPAIEKPLLLLLFRILYLIWVLEYFYICGEIEILEFRQLLEKCKWLNSLCVLPSVSTAVLCVYTWQYGTVFCFKT